MKIAIPSNVKAEAIGEIKFPFFREPVDEEVLNDFKQRLNQTAGTSKKSYFKLFRDSVEEEIWIGVDKGRLSLSVGHDPQLKEVTYFPYRKGYVDYPLLQISEVEYRNCDDPLYRIGTQLHRMARTNWDNKESFFLELNFGNIGFYFGDSGTTIGTGVARQQS